jgi:hypothetical protein
VSGEVVGVRLVDLCSKRKYKTIHCAMQSEKQNTYIIIGFYGWVGGMMKSFRGLEISQQLFSKVCVCVLFVSVFYCFFFKSKYLDFRNSKRLQQSIEFTRSITLRMNVVLCKDFWNNDWGNSMWCIHVFCLVKWSKSVKEIGSWDLCGSKDFEKKGEWLQES